MFPLVHLAEEIRKTSEARLLVRDGEDLVIVSPLPAKVPRIRRPRTRTEADLSAFRASARSWSDVDVDRFLANNAESRRLSTRPPIDL
jgi:hypothetical protein